MNAFTTRLFLMVAMVGGTAGRADAAFGVNLIVNSGAEAGQGSLSGADVPVPGWTKTGSFTAVAYAAGGGFPSETDPGPAARGLNFFFGGFGGGDVSTGSQVIDASADAAFIDAGGVSFNLSGFLGGYASQNDTASLSASFLGAGGLTLGSAIIGPVTNVDRGDVTGLLFRSTSGVVPIGTRSINIVLEMRRQAGDANDGYADNLSLVLNASPAAVPEPSSLVMCGVALAGLGAWAGLRRG